jgi:hypothetical protein
MVVATKINHEIDSKNIFISSLRATQVEHFWLYPKTQRELHQKPDVLEKKILLSLEVDVLEKI